jgi:glucose/arabinose dehydrogenase
MRRALALLLLAPLASCSCTPDDPGCQKVSFGFGPAGQLELEAEVVATGLDVPWAIAFVDADTFFVTERPGRVRLVEQGELVGSPVLTLDVHQGGEAGLLGLALSPGFADDRLLYLYRTLSAQGNASENVVERYLVDEDLRGATLDRVILDGIPAFNLHDGGRIRFGPDGMLYITTGDARVPERSQDLESLGGKLLRVTPDGDVPADNPFDGSPVFVLGVRNSQGFDWIEDDVLVLVDHGPSGEVQLRTGHDELNVVRAGDNLGWPDLYACEAGGGLVAPRLTWVSALPPGGASIYRGENAELSGSIFIAALGARQLQRVVLDEDELVSEHEVYLQGVHGRLREATTAPDGSLFFTTSNCDGRGACPEERDVILRIP